MTARAARWDLVGHGEDPVPATSWDVRGVRADYAQRASALGEAVSVLDRLARLDGWTGEAAESFASHASDRLEDLRKVVERYEGASEALEAYAGAVEDARSRTGSAVADAEAAQQQVERNDRDLLSGVVDPTPELMESQRLADRARADGAAAVSDAARRVREAVADLEAAARACADGIRSAADGYKDGWKDDFKGVVRDIAPFLKGLIQVLEVVAAVVAVITLIVVLVGTAPAWLLIAGVGLAATILVSRTLLVTIGEASWGDVAWDTANLALAMFGFRAVRAATQTVETSMLAARETVEGVVRSTATQRIPAILTRIGSIRTPGLGWLGRGASRLGDIVGDTRGWWAARGFARDFDAVGSGARETLRVMDRNVATNLSRVRYLESFRVPDAIGDLTNARQGLTTITRWSWFQAYRTGDAVIDTAGDLTGLPLVTPWSVPPTLIDEGIEQAGHARSWVRELVTR